MPLGFCFAQKPANSLFFDYLTISEGLSHNTVYAVLQDRHGYIWVGTQNGLNKYDGYTFEQYQSHTGPGFVGTNVLSIYEDQAGNLWVGTRKSGVNLKPADSDRFINFNENEAFAAIKGYEVTGFLDDGNGNIWIATNGAGLLRYNLLEQTSQIYNTVSSGLSDDRVFDLVQDTDGTLWVATAGIGLNWLQPNGKFQLDHANLPDNPDMNGYRKCLYLDGDYLWIGTEGTGLYRMHTRERDYLHFPQGEDPLNLNSNLVRDVCKASDGRIFIATDGGGLNIYDPEIAQIDRFQYQAGQELGLNSNALYALLEDNNQNIWIGTFNGGLNVLKKHKTWFDFFRPKARGKNELVHRSVLAISQRRNGEIWVGTDGGGLNVLNGNKDQYVFSALRNIPGNANSLSGNVVKAIYEDEQGRLWIGMFDTGLDMYNPQTGRFEHFQNEYGNPNSLSQNNVWSITQDKNGDFLIGTIGGGLNVFSPKTNTWQNYQYNPQDTNGIAESNIMMVFIDREERIWVGTANNGLDIWDRSANRFIHHQYDSLRPSSLSNNEVRAIFQDRKGNIWVGTEGGGLNKWLGDNRFERIGLDEGLISNSVMGIAEDASGYLWISTFEGISRMNSKTGEIRNFDFHSGEQTNQFNQMAILTAEDGTLFFGGINGLHAIEPAQVKEQAKVRKIIFTDLKVFDQRILAGVPYEEHIVLEKPIEQADHIRLSYFDNSFSLSFSAMDFTKPREQQFEYQMEGFDDNWRTANKGQNSITYTNLDPGYYTFKVRAGNVQNQIQIYIRPPFWKTLWFRASSVILLLGIIGVIGYLYLIRREAELKRKMLEVESEVLQLRNEKLKSEVNAKNSKLMSSAIQMAHKNEVLNKIKQELLDLGDSPEKKLRQVLRSLDREIEGEDYWEEFNLYFNQVDSNFVQKILDKHPGLTQNDLRICTLTRINLNTKEMASLLNISVRGVEKSRYRLKKRLGLEAEDDLTEYILSFTS